MQTFPDFKCDSVSLIRILLLLWMQPKWIFISLDTGSSYAFTRTTRVSARDGREESKREFRMEQTANRARSINSCSRLFLEMVTGLFVACKHIYLDAFGSLPNIVDKYFSSWNRMCNTLKFSTLFVIHAHTRAHRDTHNRNHDARLLWRHIMFTAVDFPCKFHRLFFILLRIRFRSFVKWRFWQEFVPLIDIERSMLHLRNKIIVENYVMWMAECV